MIVGRRELGKTTLAYYMTRKQRRRVILDPRGMIPTDGRDRVRDVADLPDAFDQLAANSGADVICTPDENVQACFDVLCRELRQLLTDDDTPTATTAFLVDEMRFVDTTAPSFDWLLRCAPRAAVSVILTAHRPIDVPPDIRGIADQWIVFKSTHDADLKLIGQHCGADVAATVQQLAPYEFVAWDDARGAATVYKNSSAWFVPLRDSRRESDAAAKILGPS